MVPSKIVDLFLDVALVASWGGSPMDKLVGKQTFQRERSGLVVSVWVSSVGWGRRWTWGQEWGWCGGGGWTRDLCLSFTYLKA